MTINLKRVKGTQVSNVIKCIQQRKKYKSLRTKCSTQQNQYSGRLHRNWLSKMSSWCRHSVARTWSTCCLSLRAKRMSLLWLVMILWLGAT